MFIINNLWHDFSSCPVQNTIIMVLYTVTWMIASDLTKGKGRAKNAESYFAFQVLCRNSKDAISCLEYYFHHVFPHRSKFCLDDGEVTLRRTVIDSRGFHPHYLMLEKMKEPIDLINMNNNVLRANVIFGLPRY